MKQNKSRKGFTLVELLVVIAILAVLATVTIVGYTNFINKANISNDTAVCKQMNIVLQSDEVEGNTPDTMDEVTLLLEENGFKLENLNPTAEGNIFVWDSAANRIIYIDEDGSVIYSEDSSLTSLSDLNPTTCWLTVKNADEITKYTGKLSFYFASNIEDEITLTNSSLDTGTYTATSVSYGQTASATDEISIYGNITTLTVNNSNGSYTNYSNVDNLTINNVSGNSWHENGYVKQMTVASDISATANIVIETKGMVEELTNSSSSVSVTNNGYINNVTAGQVTNNGYVATSSGTLTGTGAANGNYTYTIANYSELASFRDKVNAGNHFTGLTVELTANIDISAYDWVPIGYDSRDNYNNKNYIYFAGTFDGGNYTISGLNNGGFTPTTLRSDTYGNGSATVKENNYLYGLFGIVHSATIKNLNMTNVNIDGSDSDILLDSVGAIVGFADGQIEMTNCTASGTIIGTDAVGGLIGRIYYGQLETTNCSSTISDCSANMTLEVTGTNGGLKVAGIVGYTCWKNSKTQIATTLTNCAYSGSISNTSTGSGGYVSGLINYNNPDSLCTINNCTVNAAISGTAANVNLYKYVGFDSVKVSGNIDGTQNLTSADWNTVKQADWNKVTSN